jgi:hypothetical protein
LAQAQALERADRKGARMTYIFRPGGYNVTAAETATITPTFGGAAPFVPGPWYQGPWAADPTVPAIAPAACLIAYQSKWAGGPYTRSDAATYANSLINLANPGT